MLHLLTTARDDARHCESITRRHARTFYLASHLLPTRKRRAAYSLYAFCRVADDLVDDTTLPRDLQRTRLARYRWQLDAALNGQPCGPVFREVARVTEEFSVSPAPLYELLDGVAQDLDHRTYQSWPELERYCQGVASSVGEMCTYVMGVCDDVPVAHAVPYARTLGVAMQLTNILRDVGEDAARGRCYLPMDELARHGLTERDVLSGIASTRDTRWQALMQSLIARARTLYRAAEPGIAMLAPDARRCAMACAVGYEGILSAIEQLEYDSFTSRARLSRLARAAVLWEAWRGRVPASIAGSPALTPIPHEPARIA